MTTHTSNAQHTPGPFSAMIKGSKYFIDGEDGLTVAYVDRAGVRDKKEIEANVALIAASPALLAVCQRLASWQDLPIPYSVSAELIRQAGEAIASATGESAL